MNKNDVTIIVATSVLPSHPDTKIIDETISTIRSHFPKNEIILQMDGLREERISRKLDYDEYKNRVLWKCLHEWENVLPIIFDEHYHQTTMMKKTINIINTAAMLYVEGDAPITPDCEIDWQKCLDMLEYEKANTIRFHFEAFIPKEHSHLMFGLEDGFMKTAQWSQRPHLSTVKYYKDVILPFSDDKTFIEDRLHGKIQDDILPYDEFDQAGWNQHKLWIYHPEGSIKRSYHLDGREGTQKFTKDDDAWGYIE
jgi:exopolysaccharide biosynthesis predicted pyruvyltransferase EpsI